ncbi:alpha/beta fold hydrolase [Pontivivens ytuae]|uniref:Alpha/beta fold hydrolase n=1 Tax=Pontivivens ytuae TaxID=2789856 RepID=A0A7S9QDI0_9RHOB|nr:alpha/beta hydrolase [Pontivivens ytuae]QPH54156.1 alpha/beta fold hydrolase [Pontivivens ytuae]
MAPLLLIPGMMCDARLFAPQIAAFSGARAIHVAPMRAETTEEIAAQILAQAPPRFALAGLSMGGIVAMEIAAQAPERIERIALMDTNPRAELPEVRAAREPQIEAVRGGRLREVMRDEMKPRYLADGPGKQAILDLCMEMALGLGPEVFIAQSRALQTRPDRQEVLKTLDIPALVLCGEHDVLCPLDRHELMDSLLPNSTLTVVAGAGHLPVLERPEETNAALTRWLEA